MKRISRSIRTHPARWALAGGGFLLAMLIGIAFLTDSSWQTFWPDLIIGVVGAGGIGAILVVAQHRTAAAATRAVDLLGWRGALARVTPFLQGHFSRADYEPSHLLVELPRRLRGLTERIASIDELERWAVSLGLPEVTALAEIQVDSARAEQQAADLDSLIAERVDALDKPVVRKALRSGVRAILMLDYADEQLDATLHADQMIKLKMIGHLNPAFIADVRAIAADPIIAEKARGLRGTIDRLESNHLIAREAVRD